MKRTSLARRLEEQVRTNLVHISYIFMYAHLLFLVSAGYAPNQVQLGVSFWNTVDLKEFVGVFIF